MVWLLDLVKVDSYGKAHHSLYEPPFQADKSPKLFLMLVRTRYFMFGQVFLCNLICTRSEQKKTRTDTETKSMQNLLHRMLSVLTPQLQCDAMDSKWHHPYCTSPTGMVTKLSEAIDNAASVICD